MILLLLALSLSCSGDDPVQPKNQPPSVPEITGTAPPNNQSGANIDLTLMWKCSDPEGETIHYDVHFGLTSTPPLVSSGQITPSYKPPTLEYNTRYYWRVVAIDPQGNLTSSDTWTFNTMEQAPACVITPTSLGFGQVVKGQTKELSFTITNGGGGTLSGTVNDYCTNFSIIAGWGSYDLTEGQSKTVTVRYTPGSVGNHECSILTGCDNGVTCTGIGAAEPPVCILSATYIHFGDVELGGYKDASFTIRNGGDGTLEGFISESCPEFSIVDGLGAYALAKGQSKTITIRYTPTDSATATCVVYTGCDAEVGLIGNGVPPPPECSITSDSLDFGEIRVGQSADLTFTISNIGGGVLTGAVTSGCAEFTLPDDSAYSLAAGESQDITVRFTPVDSVAIGCAIATGCNEDVMCLGAGLLLPPTCALDTTVLDFGDVEMGTSKTLTTYLRNVGNGILTGTVSGACTEFVIQTGAGEYELGAAESHEISIFFAPADTGLAVCTVLTDCDLPLVCYAKGVPAPAVCDISPTGLNFGQVAVGQHKDMNFVVTNSGGSLLTGTVSETCGEFSVVAGSESFSLPAGGSKAIAIRFEPMAEGSTSCFVMTSCGTIVDCRGEGLPAPPMCVVTPTVLQFGNVEVGGSATMDFTITNAGGGTLKGDLSESCDEFAINPSDGHYNLSAGESHTVEIEYTPTVVGANQCWIVTECDDSVQCLATAIPTTPECQVIPTALDFGDVQVGQTKELDFTFTNIAGGTLTGTVFEDCDEFSLIAGEGDYSLANGESHVVTVSYTPTVEGSTDCKILTGCAEDVGVMGSGAPPCVPTVLTPTSSDIWCRANTKYITWDIGDCDAVWDVDLYKGDALVCNLYNDITSTGDILWLVTDCGNGSGDDYQIMVTNVSTGVSDLSDYFAIETCAPVVSVPVGGESLCLDDKLTIEWNTGTCTTGKYNVDLYKDGGFAGNIRTGDLNSDYLWTVDDFGGGEAATYQIKVTNTVSGCFDYSNEFSIADCPK
ncbi:MAG: choice-of-anchor D domain-containing protein [bacterium]